MKNLLGSNQFKSKPRITVGGMCGASLAIALFSFATIHYMAIAISSGVDITKQWAKETFIVIADAPTKLISPLPLESAYASESAVPTPTPKTELENIVAYIARVFEPEGKDVVVRAINCFYSESGLRSDAVGQNSDGPKSKDYGVAQLNGYWHKLTPEEKTEYKANIDRAYKIYKGRSRNGGNGFSAWYGKACN